MSASHSVDPNSSSPLVCPKQTHLLQLLVLQVASHHHLQHNKQLAVADVPIAIDIVDLECKAQLLFLVALAAEGAEAGHEFLEIDVAATVFVEDGDHACGQRVRGDLRELEEFFALDRAGAVLECVLVVRGWVFGGNE